MGTCALLALSLLIQASPGTDAISIPGMTARVPIVLDRIAELSGKVLVCAPELGDRVVYVEVSGLSFAAIQEGLGKALDATWESTQGKTVLKPNTREREQRRKAYSEKTVERIKSTLDEIRGGYAKEFDVEAALALKSKFDGRQSSEGYEGFREREQLAYGTPVGRLLFDLLSDLDLYQAATLDGQRFALYSNKRSQLFSHVTLPANRLKQYDREQAVWDQHFETSRTDGRLSFSNIAAERSGTQLPVDRVCIAFGRYSALPNFFVSMALFDQFGTIKGIARFNVFMKGFDAALATPDRSAQGEDTVIELSDRAKKYLGSFAFEPDDARLPASDPMYREILDPLKNEPLAFWVGDLAHSFGARTGGNVFASLDDGLYYDLNAVMSAGKVSAAALEGLLVARSQYEFIRDDGYTVVRQTDPDRADRNTTPRSYLAELSKELDENGYLSLESLIRFSRVDTSPNGTAPAIFFHTRALVSGYERVLQFLDRSTLRILGTLTPQERLPLLEGQSLFVNSLSGPSRNALNAMIASETVWDQGDSPTSALVPGELRVPLWFPDGVTPNLQLSLKSNGESGLAVWNAPYENFAAWYSFGRPRDTAGAIARFQRQEVQHKFWYGPALDFRLSATLGQSTIGTSDLFAPLFDLRKPPIKVDDLPEHIQKMIRGG